ncbi:MAG: hypothetical protein U1A28_03465, partial [Patescibacteria group bacterium]|nr:hypothetical protein [Patescibacteria group bacterium]
MRHPILCSCPCFLIASVLFFGGVAFGWAEVFFSATIALMERRFVQDLARNVQHNVQHSVLRIRLLSKPLPAAISDFRLRLRKVS